MNVQQENSSTKDERWGVGSLQEIGSKRTRPLFSYVIKVSPFIVISIDWVI
jgi:hypothetical protein